MTLVIFREKFRFFSFDFRQNFEVRTISRWLSEHMRNQKFLEKYPYFFFKMFTWVHHRKLSMRRTNFRVCSASGKMLTVFTCTSMLSIPGNDFYRSLSIWGNDLNAGWAYPEMFKSRISRPNRIRFSKIVLQALGSIRIRVLQKK